MARPTKAVKTKLDRASGRYMIAFREAPTRYHSSPETDEARAIAWANRNKNRLLAEEVKPLLFRDMAPGFFMQSGDWYADRVGKGRSMTAASLKLRQSHIDNYLIPMFGDYDIRAITGEDINLAILKAQRFTALKGSKTVTAAKPLTRSTRSKLLYSMKLMFDRWVSLNLVAINPTAGIIKYSKDPERPRDAIPREVLPKLFPATHGELVRVWGSSMWAALMLVLYDTGARSGEPRAKRWNGYYPERAFFPIKEAIEGGTSATIKGTKSSGHKPGYLQARTVQELAIWRSESRFNRDEDFIFTLSGDAPITTAAIGDAFKRALTHLGYKATGWTPYWLRHSFVTYSMESLTEAEVMMLAGHSSKITDKIYQHPDDETLYRQSAGARKKLNAARSAHDAEPNRKHKA